MSSCARRNRDDHRMIAERNVERIEIAQCPDGIDAYRGIVDFRRRVTFPEPDRYAVFTAQPFTPYNQLKPAVTVLQKQVVNGSGAFHDREVELPGRGEGAPVVQDGRHVVEIDRRLAR